ncbi:HAMP domain-containing sensor histidine kinase [Neolewinella lacunae]|uniref:histidine kinase n=1 Tax=Neolewinella lacunae TaxID=1517758 RepID=A0A923PHN6_9BACT|nr:HAMP domain-containing sensor histidine kinase [Neolewinella lacunae]MBC6994260.1 HAMP domain-containing histidine kinase [Neolewinella lacunae]MDN3637122.1 HAMP domain-containing sensor histidine kinase [Neolewinella lacunae]
MHLLQATSVQASPPKLSGPSLIAWPNLLCWCLLWAYVACLPGGLGAQADWSEEAALSIHYRAREHYIAKDSARLAALTDSVCTLSGSSAIQQGACEECRGFNHLLWQRYAAAKETYERSAAHFARAQIIHLEAQGLNNAGWAALRTNASKEAIALFDAAEQLLSTGGRSRKDSLLLCNVYEQKISSHEQHSQYTLVFTHGFKMLNLAENLRDTSKILSALETLMLTYRAFGEIENGVPYTQQMYSIYESPGEFYNPLKAIELRLLTVRNVEEANQYLAQATQITFSEPEHPTLPDVWYSYALAMLGPCNQPETAAPYFQKVLDASAGKFKVNRFSIIWSQIYLAEIAIIQKDYPEAISRGQEAFAAAQRMNDPSMLSQIHQYLSNAFFATQQLDSAYAHLEKAFLLKTSMQQASDSKEFMRTHLNNAFAKEKEILELQQAQKQFASLAQIKRQRTLLTGAALGLLLVGGLAFVSYRNYRLKQSAADKLQEINQQLLVEQEKLRRSNDKLMRFTGVVSHDILSNLNLLLSTGSVLVGSSPKTPNLIQYYDISRDIHRQLKNYCLGLLTEARRTPAQRKVPLTDPTPIAQKVLDRLGPALRDANFQVSLQPLSPCPLPPAIIEQVFQNLISNACRYAGHQPAPTLRIAEEKDPLNHPCWVVEDNGPGISPALEDTIFSAERQDHSQGQHLGLHLLRTTLYEYGASIHHVAPPEGGTRFIVTFLENTPLQQPTPAFSNAN